MRVTDPDVLVAGAGPVGLFAALALGRHGLSVRLVEEEWRPAGRSYAVAVHPESLRLFADHGVLDRMLATGHRVDVLAFYEAAERRRERRLDTLEVKFPFVLALPQSDLERVLVEALAARGIEVEWNHRVAALAEETDGLHVDVQKLEKTSSGYAVAATEWVVGSVEKLRPRVLAGADGHRSTVRSLLQLDWETTGPSELYAVFEFDADGGPPVHEARFTTDALGTSAFWPLPGGRWRWSVPVVDEGELRWRTKSRLAVSAGQPEDLEVLTRLLASRLPWFTGTAQQVHWVTLARFERRTSSAWGRGRTWLLGDAAHLGGPLAVQSMNAGLREGATFAACVAAVIHGHAPLEMLEEYGRSAHAGWATIADQPIAPYTSPLPREVRPKPE